MSSFQIRIGDLVLDDTILLPVVQGLSKPKVRVSAGDYSGRDGGWLSGQLFKSREIVIQGEFNEGNCADLQLMREALEDALPIRQSIPFFVTNFVGATYYADVYFVDLQMDISDKFSAPFQLTLLAPDPYLYDAGDGIDPDSGYITEVIYKIVGGGYVTPYILPVTWDPGSTPTIVDNTSDVYIFPEIVLTGQFTNPRITNNTTGQFIELGVTTTTGDVIEIDMKNRTVTLNGGSILPTKTGTWWGLQSGENAIELTTDSGSDAMSGIIRYRIAYEGI